MVDSRKIIYRIGRKDLQIQFAHVQRQLHSIDERIIPIPAAGIWIRI